MLKINNLHVSHGKIKALHGVNLRVEKGEIVSLIGANGAGKSTLLKTLSGLLAPVEGEIVFNGERIDGRPPHVIARKGLIQIPEGRRIFPHLTVQENLSLGAFPRRDKRRILADMDHVFETFPVIKNRRRQLGGTLSGGEQQMLAFGRALMSRPKLLALDEPSMGLSPVLVDRVFATIKNINRDGVTILLVEQNARLALSLSKRGYVMETGHCIIEGASDQLLSDARVKKCYLGIQEIHMV